ncbi:unnamed protein product, partial [Bubo scandiacus]
MRRGSDTEALVGTWCPARVNPPQYLLLRHLPRLKEWENKLISLSYKEQVSCIEAIVSNFQKEGR